MSRYILFRNKAGHVRLFTRQDIIRIWEGGLDYLLFLKGHIWVLHANAMLPFGSKTLQQLTDLEAVEWFVVHDVQVPGVLKSTVARMHIAADLQPDVVPESPQDGQQNGVGKGPEVTAAGVFYRGLEVGAAGVFYKGHRVRVTGKPRHVLEHLLSSRWRTRTAKELLEACWDGGESGTEANVKDAVYRLRQALRAAIALAGDQCEDPVPCVGTKRDLAWELKIP
jgi:hypothetical protein